MNIDLKKKNFNSLKYLKLTKKIFSGLSIVKKINSPNLRLMLDIFHLQQICGNLTYSIREYLPYVGEC